MRKHRYIWTPDELLAEARQVVEAVSASFETPVAPAQEQPKQVPVLLPKPVRPQPAVKVMSIAELRKAQRAERARRRFNKKVQKSIVRKSKELTKALKTQGQTAVKAVKAANVAHKLQNQAQSAEQAQRAKAALTQAKAALKAAEAARRKAKELRKQLEVAIAWLKAERERGRRLDAESKARLRWRVPPQSWLEDDED